VLWNGDQEYKRVGHPRAGASPLLGGQSPLIFGLGSTGLKPGATVPGGGGECLGGAGGVLGTPVCLGSPNWGYLRLCPVSPEALFQVATTPLKPKEGLSGPPPRGLKPLDFWAGFTGLKPGATVPGGGGGFLGAAGDVEGFLPSPFLRRASLLGLL